jgi:transcriptional regulator with PAS, ATPase and Fis domain
MDIIESYPWPGNVRELENAIEYAVNMETQNTIRTCNLPNTLLKKSSKEDLPLKERMKNAEYTAIKSMLDRYGWDMEGKTRVADELDISLRTLYRIIKKNQ